MGILVDRYDSSFGSTDFWEQDGGALNTPRVSAVTRYHIGGTDDDVLLDRGLTGKSFQIKAGVEGAELDALETARGTTGTLTLNSRGSLGSCLLTEVTPVQKVDDYFTIMLTFEPL